MNIAITTNFLQKGSTVNSEPYYKFLKKSPHSDMGKTDTDCSLRAYTVLNISYRRALSIVEQHLFKLRLSMIMYRCLAIMLPRKARVAQSVE
jgi:hypothetical protein